MGLAVCVCAVVLMYVVDRARVGLRARRFSGAHLRIVDRVAAAVGPALARTLVAGALVGAWFSGWLGAALGCLGGWLWWGISQRRERAAEAAHLDAQVPDAMRAIAAGLRAGGSLRQAIEASGEEMPEPIGRHLAGCAARCALGMTSDDALLILSRSSGTAGVQRMVETLRVGATAPASLPAILDAAANAQQEWARLNADRRAASAQVRISALVVAGMPVVFIGLAGQGPHGPAQVLLGEPIGWVALAIGLGLDLLGWRWMRSLFGGRA